MDVTTYQFVKFLHIATMVGMFAGITMNMGVLHFARNAKDVQSVRALMVLGAFSGRIIPLFSIIVLLTGVYMVEDVWDWEFSWIRVSLVAYVILFAMGPLVNGRRARAIGMEAGQSPDGPIPSSLAAKLNDPILQTSERTMGLATLGIVYLMVVKPDTTDSILALVVAVILGLALSAGAWLQPKSAAPAAKSPD